MQIPKEYVLEGLKTLNEWLLLLPQYKQMLADWFQTISWGELTTIVYGKLIFLHLVLQSYWKTEDPPTVMQKVTNAAAGAYAFASQVWHYRPEKAMKGSDFLPVKPEHAPRFLCKVYGRTYQAGVASDEFLGMAFRIGNVLCSAYHVVENLDETVVMSPKTSVAFRTPWVVDPENDFAYVELTEQMFSILGLSKGTLAKVEPDSYGAYAAIFGKETYSMGMVQPCDQFAKVRYSGSTAYGFSGAPYVSGTVVLGMHLGHGVQNFGLSSAWIYMRLKGIVESTESALEDYIVNQARKGRKIEVKSTGDPDYYQMKWGQTYHNFPVDRYHEIYGYERQRSRYAYPIFKKESVEYSKDLDARLAPVDVAYDDSKNAYRAPLRRSADVGAFGRIGGVGSIARQPPRLKLKTTYISPPESTSEDSDSDRLERTHVPRKRVSLHTSVSTIEELKIKYRQARRNAEKLRKVYKRLLSPGRPGFLSQKKTISGNNSA